MSFRKLQAIVDLRRAAIKQLERSSLASSFELDLLNTLRNSISERVPNWNLDLPSETLHELHLRVASADTASGFVGCTAVVLLNAISENDRHSNAEFRWKSHHYSYGALPPNHGCIIQDAYRHLYEVLRDWDPFEGQFAPERFPTNSFLPL